MGGGKGGGSQSVTMRLDPATQRYMERNVRPSAKRAAAIAGQGSWLQGATTGQRQALRDIGAVQGMQNPWLQNYLQQSQGLTAGLGQAFDPASAQQFFNPFQNEVISGMQSDFDRMRGLARVGSNQAATANAAFGGSRQAVADTLAQRDINELEGQQLGQFRYGGQQSAMNQALQNYMFGQQQGMQGLGNILQGTQFGTGVDMARAQQMFGAQEHMRALQERANQNPLFSEQQRMNFLTSGIGPFGSNQTSTSTSGMNPFGSALGGAALGTMLMPGWGTLIGGGLGLLGGLF